MKRKPFTEYVIARYKRAKLLNLPIRKQMIECAELLGLSVGAVWACLYRAGVVGEWRPMYHSDAEIMKAYFKNPSMSTLADELGSSFYSIRAALKRQGITPMDNRRTHMRTALYKGPGTPKTVLSSRES